MTVHRVRAAWAALTAVVLVVGGVVAPAMADDPPPVWDAAPGFPIPAGDGITVGFETTIRTVNPWIPSAPPAPPVPYIRPVIVNGTDEPRYFGFGMDIAARGVPEHLWEPEPWGWIANEAPNIVEPFAVELLPGQSFAETTAFIGLNDGVPQYAGRTFVIYALSGPPASDPLVDQIATFTAAGRFVPGHFDEMTEQGVPAVGQPLEVTGTGAASDVFPGVVATVEATGLEPEEELDLWLIPSFDYFYFMMLGGALPETAVSVGDGIVDAGGVLNTTIDVPATTPIGDRYQLVAGVAGERYWPAGSHRNFSITEPDDSLTEATPTTGVPLVLPFEVTDVSLRFPVGTDAGMTTVAVTATGPQSSGFQLASDPPLYYHFDTTSTWPVGAKVEVCITYDEVAIPGSPPYLQHFDEDADRWVDITTTRVPGEVCGETTSFSAFTLGFPLHDGSTAPPAKGVLSSDNGNDTGLLDGDYTITMDLWSGENAGTVRLLEGTTVVATQQLTRNSPNAQRALFPISGKANGTYVYTAELENSTGVTTTKPLTVNVKDANPGKLSLTATSPKNGAFTLTANMWWGTNATSAQFYQGGVPVGAPIALTAQTPNAQSASLSLVRAKGDYVYKVAFTNAAGTTWSSDLKVKVK